MAAPEIQRSIPTSGSTPAQSPRRLIWTEVGITAFAYQVLIMLFMVAPPLVLRAFGVRLELRSGASVTLGCTLIAELIAFGLLALWLRRRQLSFSDLGLGRKTTRGSLWAAIVFGAGYAGFTLWTLGLSGHVREVSVFRAWGMFVGVIGAAVEEVIFRGFLLTELRRIGVSSVGQVLVSALLFSLVHMGFSVGGMIATFIMGAVLAIVYMRGGRSLTPPIMGHALVNLLIEPWLLLWLISFYANQHR